MSSTSEFAAFEKQTGCRLSWGAFPASRADAQKAVVPVGAMYKPLLTIPDMPVVAYEPVHCRNKDVCNMVLNPYCFVDYRNKYWVCPCCANKNGFPAHYAHAISEQTLPIELTAGATVMEYLLPSPAAVAATSTGSTTPTNAHAAYPTVVFVLDTIMVEAEFEQAKDAILQSLAGLPAEVNVALVTYGANVYIHELQSSGFPRSYCFRGTKSLSKDQVAVQLGLLARNDPRGNAAACRRFIQPINECEYNLISILTDSVKRDSFPVPSGKRPERCTGAAISIAQALLEISALNAPGRVVVLTAGACTVGPGQVVGLSLDETIRSYLDLERKEPNTKYYAEAVKYYAGIASRAVNAGHGVDIFGCALDQTGLYEMKVLPERTGGNLVMTDTFSAGTFRGSLVKLLAPGSGSDGGLAGGFNGKMEVCVGKDLKICGGIGPMTGLGKKNASVSDTEIGESGTVVWGVSVLNEKSCFAIYFEPVGSSGSSSGSSSQTYLQFQTMYTSGIGQRHLRVCTLAVRSADSSSNLAALAAGFDQETAIALMARYAVVKKESEDAVDVQRWIDRMLIRLVSRFADYRKDEPSSFHLSPEFTMYPVAMYHLRRGLFLNSFNASPDETAFYRSWLLREDVANTLTMIQPVLRQWDLEHEHGFPALLDATSLQPGSILLMDDYFMVLIWRGESIHNWIQQGYHLQEPYAHLKFIAESAELEAKGMIDTRFPVPRFINCNQGGSQARFLTARVNPSVTHNTQPGGFGPISESSVVFSDDASLKVFMDHLIKLAVQG